MTHCNQTNNAAILCRRAGETGPGLAPWWLLCLLLAALTARAEWNDVTSGTLLLEFENDADTHWVAPGLATDVDIQVSGPIVRAVVRQRFTNPGTEWANAVYVFPLPETAAVDHMQLIVGERIIEGQIHPKDTARKVYEEAKREGRKASLVSQQRSNLFTTRVANIPPGETIEVTIEYQHPVDKADNIYSLRFPMTITPRYIPGTAIGVETGGETVEPGASAMTSIQVADAHEITPPWASRGANNHPTSITVDLQPGFVLGDAQSLYHTAKQEQNGKKGMTFQVTADSHQANADFVLQWQPAELAAPQWELFTEKRDTDSYSLLMVTPPAPAMAGTSPPREVIFVIDTSGSMGGESIRQARRALLWALERLEPEDSFNVIEFNSGSWNLFSTARAASQYNLDKAKKFVSSLEARGGTEMAPTMESALCGFCSTGEKIRQVIFLTDGAIGNEDQLFGIVKTKLGNSRLFTVGIGSAPNSYFMRKAAETGRGTYTYIGDISKAGEAMARLFATLEQPLVTDLRVQLPDQPADASLLITPNPLPDLYGGRPGIVLMKGPLPDRFSLTGNVAGKPWTVNLSGERALERTGIRTLWGRQKIEELMDLYRFTYPQQEKDKLREEITAIALDHHLVSAFTSLVAVDITPSRAADEPGRDHAIANNSPKGTHFGLARTATDANLKLILGFALTLMSITLILFQRRCDRERALFETALISGQGE